MQRIDEMTWLDMVEVLAYQKVLIGVLRAKFKHIPYKLTRHIQGIIDQDYLRDLALNVPNIQSLDELGLSTPQRIEYEKSPVQKMLEEQVVATKCEILLKQIRAKFADVPKEFIERVRAIENEDSIDHLSTQILFVSSYEDMILPKTEPIEPESPPLEIETEPAAHNIVLKQLNAKFGAISDELTQRIQSIHDEDILADLATQILFVKSLDELTLPK